jgi:hypothetical protein
LLSRRPRSWEASWHGPGAGNALSQGGHLVAAVYNDCDPRHATGGNGAGNPNRRLFSMDAGTAALLRAWANPAIRSRPRGKS